MGSAKVSNARPQPPMAESEKKTLKERIKSLITGKGKEKRKKTKVPEENVTKTEKEREVWPQNHIAANTVANILDKIKKLEIKDDAADELKHFSCKTVHEEPRNDRIDSQSSEDSGFAEKYVEESTTDDESKEKDEDIIITFHKLDLDKDKKEEETEDEKNVDDLKTLDIKTEKCDITIKDDEKIEVSSKEDDKDEVRTETSNEEENNSEVSNKEDAKCAKEKKVQTVVISRGPVKNKVTEVKDSSPYYVPQTDLCRQIQINKNTLTGGQVIVNQTRNTDSLEFDNALIQVQQTSQTSQLEYGDDYINMLADVIESDLKKAPIHQENEDLLSCFFQTQPIQPTVNIMTPPHQELSPPNPIEEFSNHLNYELFENLDLNSLMPEPQLPPEVPNQFVYPTPPRSDVADSPMSQNCQMSEYMYSPERSMLLSPERSSPICNSDYESFQELPQFVESQEELKTKGKERVISTSTMTMKQYKDLQKDLSQSFSKKDCCQTVLKPCKASFQEHLKKLKMDERTNLCFKVAKMDLENASGVLQNVLINLSQSSEQEDLLLALFCLICERVLSQSPTWFVGDFGLDLLKSAVLRCPQRPLMTRYLVQCVRTAIRVKPELVQGKDSVFHEVDALGDTLLTACARRGDVCADVLGELVRKGDLSQLPLFRINHLNSEGASALHVACTEHSASCPRAHVVHVLLEHANADLWQGDGRAGENAVHMAVNSKHCELGLVMILFRHVDRKAWKKLAHAQSNNGTSTPIDHARNAVKSKSRENYPVEVLEFLKKCR